MRLVLTVPAYNEQGVLEESVSALTDFMEKTFPDTDWTIILAENASTDKTHEIAGRLSERHKQVETMHLKEKGRGKALKASWSSRKADVYAYCDADLATDIRHLPQLVGAVADGQDLAAGSRYMPGSKTERTLKRLILSRGFNLAAKIMLGTRVSDLQCGFKAVSPRIISGILPHVKNNNWFFDTELIVRAEKARGYGITEIPVTWSEKRNSKVQTLPTVREYLFCMRRLRREIQ